MSTDTYAWLQELGPGDTVIERSGPIRSLSKVTRVTKTQVIVGTTKYRRKNGHRTDNDSYDFRCIVEATPDRRDQVVRARLCAELGRIDWHSQDPDTVIAVYRLIKGPTP